ncbi:histone-like nucleoid-structuring protein, MvaT/MvaU family [Stutzerimonas stutzeri]
MSMIAEYKALEAKLAEQLKQLDALRSDKEFQREMEFEDKLRALMAEYGVNLRSLISMLDPQPSTSSALSDGRTGARRERKLKVYKHPESGEVVETKGGNNKVLKAWKAEHGSDVVEGWLQR